MGYILGPSTYSRPSVRGTFLSSVKQPVSSSRASYYSTSSDPLCNSTPSSVSNPCRLLKQDVNNLASSMLEKILSPELMKRRRTRDHILKTCTDNVRIAIINNTASVRQAKERHQLSETMTQLLGRAMSATSLLASWQKNEERIILEFSGQGPVSYVYSEAIRCGEIRAYTTTPKYIQTKNAPLGLGLRGGTLKVSKILYGLPRPYESVVPLASADITSDLLSFYKHSEQIPVHCDLETHTDQNGDVLFSGGILLEALPPKTATGSNSDYVKPYENRLRHLPPLSILFNEEMNSNMQILHKVAPGEFFEEHIEKQLIDFYCRCSKAKFKQTLHTLAKDELRKLFQLGEDLGFKCQYCSTEWKLDKDDLKELENSLR